LQKIDPFIYAFTRLGEFLHQFPEGSRNLSSDLISINEKHYEAFREIIETEHLYNPWFTGEFIHHALLGISRMLEKQVLLTWLEAYTRSPYSREKSKRVGLVLAGNIPLVGFHDLMSVLATGHEVLAKPSSKDDHLIRKVAEVLTDIDTTFKDRITFTDEHLSGMDAIIATGSDNSARYFEYYFRNIPHIIRKNRNGIAILTGEESEEELAGIGEDVFTYFGLGCRNVTKLYIPESYDLTRLMKVFDGYQVLYQHHKYGNNVDYHRTIYLMNKVPILDNGVVLLKHDESISSPVGVVFYERYSEIEWVQQQIMEHHQDIQCIVSCHPDIDGAIPPGTTQVPMPWDYADGVDTIQFLTELP